MKKVITESQLRNVIAESVNKILNEYADNKDDGAIGFSKATLAQLAKDRFSGDLNHKDKSNNGREKRLRYDGWIGWSDSKEKARNHGAPGDVILLDALDDAMKTMHSAIHKYETYNIPYDGAEDIAINLLKTMGDAFKEIRSLDIRIQGRRSDFRGR